MLIQAKELAEKRCNVWKNELDTLKKRLASTTDVRSSDLCVWTFIFLMCWFLFWPILSISRPSGMRCLLHVCMSTDTDIFRLHHASEVFISAADVKKSNLGHGTVGVYNTNVG